MFCFILKLLKALFIRFNYILSIVFNGKLLLKYQNKNVYVLRFEFIVTKMFTKYCIRNNAFFQTISLWFES